jgi:hypothetical protein
VELLLIRRTKVLYADKQVGYKLVANQLSKKSSFNQLPFQCSMVVPGAVQCTRYQYQPREQKLFKETFKAAGTSGILLPPTYFVNSVNTPAAVPNVAVDGKCISLGAVKRVLPTSTRSRRTLHWELCTTWNLNVFVAPVFLNKDIPKGEEIL